MKRRRAVFDTIREKARQDRSLDLEDFCLVALGFFHRLQYDTAKQFVILNDLITPVMAKKRKVEATGEDNGRAHTEYFDGLVSNAPLQELGAWLIELELIGYRDHAPYSYYGDGSKPDPLFDTAVRLGPHIEKIKARVTEQPKAKRSRKDSAC